MIAASDPQEFIPSGRQQALRHPGTSKPGNQKLDNDDFLDKFEDVSLKEKDNEWWVLRKADLHHNVLSNHSKPKAHEENKCISENSEFYDNSFSFKSADPLVESNKRISDINTLRRYSSDAVVRKNDASNEENPAERPFRAKNEVDYMEDELYVKGHTAIWSRGLLNCDNTDNGRKTLCSYTSELPIKHALWCTFHRQHPSYESDLFQVYERNEALSRPMPAVCIIDAHNIRVFAPRGEDFVTAIPFQIGETYRTKFGIFIEKEWDNGLNVSYLEHKATLFSLSYPLDEICPVAVSLGVNYAQVLNNSNLNLVFTSEEPSIAMAYDMQTKQHSVYRIREVTSSEKIKFMNKMNSTCPSIMNLSNKLKNRFSMWDNSKQQGFLPTPTTSRPGSVASFHNIHNSRSHNSMATISRCQSPASSIGSPWLQKISRLNSSVAANSNNQANNSFFDSSKIMSYLHTNPNICLEHLWTENFASIDQNNVARSTKVFLCDDLIGQWYLCYVLSNKCQLVMVRIDFSNSNNITFGLSSSINARDAVPVPACHMMAILEYNGNVVLYSGLNPVGKLHIGGTLVQHTPSPFIKRNLPKFTSPFPRRSSLLPHCLNTDLKFDEHLLSPVLPESSSSSRSSNVLLMNFPLDRHNTPKVELTALRDPVENRVTLCYSDGTYYRISMPPLTLNPLVEDCIGALRQCLTKDAGLALLSQWYATRNALGSQEMNLEQEWGVFKELLMELFGYETKNEEDEGVDLPVTPSCNPKRQKHSFGGTDADWDFMRSSGHEKEAGTSLRNLVCLGLGRQIDDSKSLAGEKLDVNSMLKINTSAILFPYIRLVHYCLHLLYENLKLDMYRTDDLKCLVVFLCKLAGDLGLLKYTVHYWKDFPTNCKIITSGRIDEGALKSANWYVFLQEEPLNVMVFIKGMICEGLGTGSYPYFRNVNEKSKDILQICALICKEHNSSLNPKTLLKIIDLSTARNSNTYLDFSLSEAPIPIQATLLMSEKKLTINDLNLLPPAISLLFYSALWKCRNNPPSNFPSDAYMLLWREDLASQAEQIQIEALNSPPKKSILNLANGGTAIETQLTHHKSCENDPNDGMDEIDNVLMKLRFPDDVRVLEARKMLASSQPVPIVLVQRPEVTDHDFIEEQEKHLYAICTRTMALPAGRGMFTLRTSNPVITELLEAPPLSLTGRVPPRGTSVELHHIDTPSNINLWPLFHNGVANGLKITPDAHQIDNTWIIFNKPKASVEQNMEHAGFLMALGFNGHLKKFDVLNTFNYLVKLDEMTSIGILLGLSAAYRGTSDFNMTKTLSIHIEALLPPTSMELDVHQNVQVAALLGIGLVYQGTSHRHIIEVLLAEIGRPPGPEMENSVDRESYSLAAGFSLGLVTLKQGAQVLGLSDLNVPDRLYYYMMGGNRKPLTGSQKDKYKVASFQIREGASVNLDVTAPGATIALGLMYFGSGNKAVADWMAPPDTQYMLDFVRPDFLMFRVLSRSLILWDEVEPTREWVENQIPETIRPYCMQKPIINSDIDFEAMNQAYCNIITGACFALGLKYAGSADEDAFQVLLHYCHMFTNLTIKSIAEIAGKPTIETCLNVLLLSISMVMAGTGNLEIMRLVRLLRRRVGVASSAVVSYGSHMALHMALGLLFLGGGRYTLSNTPQNIAALICAFYPKFPTHSNDNRYHLQAFRHLYVLAVELRVIIPKDVHTGKFCYANLKIVKLDSTVSYIKGPGIIPDINGLKMIAVDDERYWPVTFERGLNWDLLTKILFSNGFIEVKQRAGCLSYTFDKLGYHSQLARTLTQSEVVPWDPAPSSIISFTQEKAIKFFCNHILLPEKSKGSEDELRIKQLLTTITYEAVVKDKLVIIPIFTFLSKVLHQLKRSPSTINIGQVKLILNQIVSTPIASNLISLELILAIEQEIIKVLDDWENELLCSLNAFLGGHKTDSFKDIEPEHATKLAAFIQFYDIPFNWECFGKSDLEVLLTFQSKPMNSVKKIVNITRRKEN